MKSEGTEHLIVLVENSNHTAKATHLSLMLMGAARYLPFFFPSASLQYFSPSLETNATIANLFE